MMYGHNALRESIDSPDGGPTIPLPATSKVAPWKIDGHLVAFREELCKLFSSEHPAKVYFFSRSFYQRRAAV